MPDTHGAATRKPVYIGKRRVPGLYSRTLADGSEVFDVATRLGGKVKRRRLEATTKTEALAELRALRVDTARGEQHRSPALSVTVTELLDEFIVHMRSSSSRRRASLRTCGTCCVPCMRPATRPG